MNSGKPASLPSIWNDCLFFRLNVVFAAIGVLYLLS